MTNEMMRPCTLWGETFDACDVVEAKGSIKTIDGEGIRIILIGLKDGTYFSRRYKEHLYLKAITTISDALNAPVLATEEVLAGLPKDAKVYTFDEKTGDALRCTFDNEFGWVCRTGHFNEALKLGSPYRIFTINDSKTAEYLGQFTREGKRIKQKEMN
jgi:hypothetical protein